MGGVKNYWDSVADRGWEDPVSTICLDHIIDPYIQEHVGPATTAECSFCGRKESDTLFAVELQQVMQVFMPAFWQFYGRLTESPIFDGEILEKEDTNVAVADVGSDVFEDKVEEAILADITDAIVDFEVSVWDPRMSTTLLELKWQQFALITRVGSRYVMTGRPFERSPLAEALPFLDELVRYVDGPHNLVRTITPEKSLFRGRLLPDRGDPLRSAAEFGAPPSSRAQAGRMSPAGIRTFYGAADLDTAVAEIAVHGIYDLAQVAEWKPTRDLTILDLAQRNPDMPSAFDPDSWDAFRRLRFLHNFAAEIAKPIIPDGRQHSEYAPTQVLTEYLRFVPSTKIDGIAYPSAHTGGTNVALFIQPEGLGRPVEQLPLEVVPASMIDIYELRRHVAATRVDREGSEWR